MSELLPCPFCGGKASIVKGRESFAHRAVFKAFCLDCQSRTVSVDSRAAAASLWNRRRAPEGWQMVPSRLTPEWRAAIQEQGMTTGSVKRMVEDVLAAAPTPGGE